MHLGFGLGCTFCYGSMKKNIIDGINFDIH